MDKLYKNNYPTKIVLKLISQVTIYHKYTILVLHKLLIEHKQNKYSVTHNMTMVSSRVNLQKGQNEKEKWPFSCEDKYKQNNSANLVHPWYAQDPKMFPQMIFVLKT